MTQYLVVDMAWMFGVAEMVVGIVWVTGRIAAWTAVGTEEETEEEKME